MTETVYIKTNKQLAKVSITLTFLFQVLDVVCILSLLPVYVSVGF